MGFKQFICSIVTLIALFSGVVVHSEIKEGDKLQTLSNLHPDLNKRLLYSINYQLPSLIPVCSDIVVTSVKKKKIVFEWKEMEFTLKYDGHTKKAGIPLQKVAANFFGPKCDAEKIAKLSDIDRAGIRTGIPKAGMTRQGILYAMGRPPYHANPDLEAYTWMYWLNRFKRKAIDFNEKGIVSEVRL